MVISVEEKTFILLINTKVKEINIINITNEFIDLLKKSLTLLKY